MSDCDIDDLYGDLDEIHENAKVKTVCFAWFYAPQFAIFEKLHKLSLFVDWWIVNFRRKKKVRK